jgi:glucosamine--fructose-6-phosphate aminotransferase (isomerizing)
MPFDATVPLTGAPDPWAPSSTPARRTGPPYLMTEMIAAEPALAERLALHLTGGEGAAAMRSLADEILAASGAGGPIVTTGCGTSEHAAIALAWLLGDALGDALGADDGWSVHQRQALDVTVRPPGKGLLIAVSHEGGTWATNEALRSARAAGARTALVTVSARSPGASLADHVVETGEQDHSWCHTVGYLAPLVVAGALAGQLRGNPLDPPAVRGLLEAASQQSAGPSPADEIAKRLATSARVLVVGGGIDFVAAKEMALKVEEGSGLPATTLHLETIRHGHMASADERTSLVVVLTGGEETDEPYRDRARGLLRAAQALGMPAAAILGARVGPKVPESLTPAGRMQSPEANRLPSMVESILASAIPLQLIAERLARARGRNPDLIGRDDPRQAAAAADA